MSDLTINEKEISLFRLKSELVELMNLREDSNLTTEEYGALDRQLQAYIRAEIRKVDNVRSYLRHCEMMAEAAAEEVKRLSALGHTWKSRRERLLDLCRELMLEFGEKRLDGLHGSIVLKGNGGLQALEMGNPGLIPEELCEYRGTITSAAWTHILDMCAVFAGEELMKWEGVRLERVPVQGRVREALKNGPVAGARLQERGVHVEVK